MSLHLNKNCLKVMLSLTFMLFFQIVKAQYNFTKVNDWLDNNIEKLGGHAVLMIYKDGQIIYNHSVNKESEKRQRVKEMIAKKRGITINKKDFSENTKERIASCSKWLSAALVMTFVDEGKLKTTDSIGKYLPIFSQHGKGHITIAQCLSHLTGIYQPSLKEGIKNITSLNTMDEAMQFFATQPMEGEAGKTFHYGNIGLQIAAAVIEKISGKSFGILFNERIAKPLDMQQTDFGKSKIPLAAGGAYSSAKDYMNFLTMMLHKGTYNGKRILSEAAIAEMQKNNITEATKIIHNPSVNRQTAYGYGVWIFENNKHHQSTTISSPGLFGSLPIVDYKRNYCFFLMAYNINNKGRQENYQDLKQIIDKIVGD
jgi:CubicO group peptidase (beta-lactamase class C family)